MFLCQSHRHPYTVQYVLHDELRDTIRRYDDTIRYGIVQYSPAVLSKRDALNLNGDALG